MVKQRGSRLVIRVAAFVVLFQECISTATQTTCQVGNGCTGTSSLPVYRNLFIGGKNGEYNSSHDPLRIISRHGSRTTVQSQGPHQQSL